MTDELPSQRARAYIKTIFADYGQAQGQDVLEEMALAYFVHLGMTEGREAIERLLRERVNTSLVRRSHRKIELVVDNARAVQ